MDNSNTEIKRLPDAELDIMLVLWDETEPLRTSEILDKLNNNWALATLKVLLGRLCERGCVECTRDGRFTLYKAVLQRESYKSRETGGLLSRYYENSAKKLLAALVREDKLTKSDLDDIAKMLESAGEEDV